MKRKITKQLLTCILVLVFALQGAGCGSAPGNSKESIREKLLLAYQYLENMEFDSALDAFAAVIEIDEKIPAVYAGMARAYSAKGDHAAARDAAAKGKEMTEVNYFGGLERMYGKISDNEEVLKEIADLLKEGDEKIPGEPEESRTGLLSQALDQLWEKLDGLDIYDLIGSDTLVYPVDPEKGIYLILFPDNRFYLGEVRYIPFSELLSQAENLSKEGEEAEAAIPEMSLSDIVLPVLEGRGIQAGLDQKQMLADLYIGEWKNSLPDGQGAVYAWQYIPGGPRFVYHGGVSAGLFTGPEAAFGSSKLFLVALGITEASYDELQEMRFELTDARGEGRSLPEEERDVIYDLLYDHPIAQGDSIKTHVEELYCLMPLTRPSFIGRAGAGRSQISYQNGQYTSDFENREYIELIEQGAAEDAVIRGNQERSPAPIDGALLYVDSDLRVTDYDLDHGVYFTIPFMKDTYIPLYVLNGLGERLLRTYERMVWFTESGFSALFLAKEGSDKAYSDYIEWGISGQGDPGEVYQIDYDWDGNEIKRTLLGKMADLEKFTRYEQHSDMAAASGSPIRAEKTDSGIKVTDSDGNSLGTISVEEPSQWSIQINGKMILINNQADHKHYLFAVWND